MLREKSGNTSLTKWLDKTKHQKQPASTRINAPSTVGMGQGHENNKEEMDIQRAIEQSRKDYMTQQKQQYTTLSSLYSTSETTYAIPSIDDDDAWFQTTPTLSPSRSTKRNKLSLSIKRSNSNLSSPKRKVDNNDSPTQSSSEPVNNVVIPSPKLASQSTPENDTQDLWKIEASQEPKKEEEESWTIEEDDSWEIQSSQKAKVEEDTSWEINGTEEYAEDKTTSNETPPDDELNEYMSAIRNRSTKNVSNSSKSSIPQQQLNQMRRSAILLDDAFHLISKDQDPPRQKKKPRYINAETDPTYNPPRIYQTLFNTDQAHRHDTQANSSLDSEPEMDDYASDCSSIIDLCMESERRRLDLIDPPIDNNISYMDDDGGVHDDLDSLPCADDDFDFADFPEDDFNTTVDDQHPFEIDDAPIENHSLMEEDDSGYLSPLEGFVSLLDQPAFNSNYQPYFDQLDSFTVAPSRSRAKPSSKPRPARRTTPKPKGKRRFFSKKRYK